ncbi:MAG: hypothetical protein AB7P76_13100 [Candidatus Melainabacteria bacterium]
MAKTRKPHVKPRHPDGGACLRAASPISVPAGQSNPLSIHEGATECPAPEAGWRILEADRRLSESLLWDIQNDYYCRQGVAAWQNSVPFYITNSAFIAESYGQMIIAMLRDLAPKLDRSQPVYILELSAGTGQFGFLVLRELFRKLPQIQALKDLRLCYVMCDVTEKNVAFWQNHPRLQPYLNCGMLETACFNPVTDTSLTLSRCGKTLSPEDFTNPAIVIGNYLFDTIRQDLFQVTPEAGLLEGRVTLAARTEHCPENGYPAIEHIVPTTHYQPHEALTPENPCYYEDPTWNRILAEYAACGEAGSVIMPVGALETIAALTRLTQNNWLLMASDKGYPSAGAMLNAGEHPYAAHGAFSFPVNFDALLRYAARCGTAAWSTCAPLLKLQTLCCAFTPLVSPCCENTSLLFRETLNRQNTLNTLVDVDSMAIFYQAPEKHPLSIDLLMGVLRLCLAEPQTMCTCAPHLIHSLSVATETQKQELRQLMHQAWDQYYFFPGACQLPFALAQLSFHLGDMKQCLAYVEQTQLLFGHHEALRGLLYDCLRKLQNEDSPPV